MYPLYVISGLSGSGKTTLGEALAKKLRFHFVDQDFFYLKEKPLVTLSDDSKVKNWDCLEALDSNFKHTIEVLLQREPVLLAGFALSREMLPVIPAVHIHLVTADNPTDLEERCRKARIQAKPHIKADRDVMVVREITIPFYHRMVRESDITHLVSVFDPEGKRIPLDWLTRMTKKIIRDSPLLRDNIPVMDVNEPYFTQIQQGKKTVEGRKITETWRHIRRGDLVTLRNGTHYVIFTVELVNYYLPSCGDPLGEYLLHETLDRTLPGVPTIEEGRAVYLQWWTREEIQKHGMMGIRLS
jgi:ASC-1-like (ASCH) protein/cytidylate kinase